MNKTQGSAAKANILIVDDTPDNLRFLSTMLIERGYKVRSALNGAMALKGVEAAPPDLILLDINMPEINGYQVCEELKKSKKNRDIPVIFLSALDDTLDKVKAFACGGADYITKPFQFEEVLVRVENQLSIRYLQQQLIAQNSILQQSEAKEREKSQELELTLRQLQQTQTQLIQSEKKSSLDTVIAGIAHEINNAINFISGNLGYAGQYTSDLLQLLELYQQALPHPVPGIQNFKDRVDFEFVRSDFPQILASMNAGSKRIRDIVLSLRNFSRLGEAEFKAVDIHCGIDSTLMILQSRLNSPSDRFAIQILKEYDSLPLVECWASEINQVFMNILCNAIEALELRIANSSSVAANGEPLTLNSPVSSLNSPQFLIPKITIRTELIDSERVAISIADNGVGMVEDVKKRVFDPFFTTKKIGSGPGLGLSICYQIVAEAHGGQLFCQSEAGVGTTFTVVLPVKHSQSP